jgi:hypothetical protein
MPPIRFMAAGKVPLPDAVPACGPSNDTNTPCARQVPESKNAVEIARRRID